MKMLVKYNPLYAKYCILLHLILFNLSYGLISESIYNY